MARRRTGPAGGAVSPATLVGQSANPEPDSRALPGAARAKPHRRAPTGPADLLLEIAVGRYLEVVGAEIKPAFIGVTISRAAGLLFVTWTTTD
jgi:hypothetical protein